MNNNSCILDIQPLAKEDFKKLSPELRDDALKQLKKLENNMYVGIPLENKNGRDLSSCRKLFFGKATYRIVYRIRDNVAYVESFVDVLAIGPRADEKVYKDTASRLIHEDITTT